MLSTLTRKINTLRNAPIHTIRAKLFYKSRLAESERYLSESGVLEFLRVQSGELPPHAIDLAHLHKKVLATNPLTVLEFGSGQSTIVIAHALAKLANANPKNAYKLYSIDGSKHWTEVTRAKIPKDLQSFVDLRYSKPIITRFNDRICHRHEQLPNITPDFIYLDGPSPYDVEGVDACGIGFTQEDGNNRSAMSCDVLLYEPFVSTGCTIVIDTRMNNSSFVIKNLQRNWKHAWDSVFKVHVLELTDWKKR